MPAGREAISFGAEEGKIHLAGGVIHENLGGDEEDEDERIEGLQLLQQRLPDEHGLLVDSDFLGEGTPDDDYNEDKGNDA